MIYSRRGQYQMQNQELFRYAPITKAWLCITLLCSVIYMYLSLNGLGSWVAASLGNVLSIKGILRTILSKLVFQSPTSLISGIVLLYYGRWVERRFGSCKFMNFLLLNFLQSTGIEIAIYLMISRFHEHASMYFAIGPYALLTALYLTYVKEMPVVSYASILGLSLSVHSLPFIMFVQLLELSKPIMIAGAAGAVSVTIYQQFSRKLNLIPAFLVHLFQSTANPIGWLAQKFAECGEFGNEGRILPVAATVERQRIEIIDNYERRLMFGQMQRIYRNERVKNFLPDAVGYTGWRAHPSDNQLHFLNRLLGGPSSGATLPSEEQVRQLVDMGLGSRQVVREALQQCGNDASEAANLLLHNRR